MTRDEQIRWLRDYALDTISSIHDSTNLSCWATFDATGQRDVLWAAIGTLASGLAALAEQAEVTT